ncbi:hypothetical protein EMGBS1_05080 [Chloroflexota bacterium]|nr:hypothetical protein EMGBS1_05080 [Chloroflexota bacterium]
MLLPKVFNALHAKLLAGCVFKIQARQCAQRGPLRAQQIIYRRCHQVQMLAVRKVRQKEKNQPEGEPPGNVLQGYKHAAVQPAKGGCQCAGKRLPCVRRVLRNFKAGAQQPEAHMKKNEHADHQRVAPDAGGRIRPHQAAR